MANKNTILRALFSPITAGQGNGSSTEFTCTDSASANVNLKLPAGLLTGNAAVIRIRGIIGATSGNLTLKLYKGTDKTGTLLATTGAITTPGTGAFLVEFVVTGDSTSSKLYGFQQGHVGGVLLADTVISNATFDPTIENTLAVSGTWSGAGAQNMYLTVLEVDRL